MRSILIGITLVLVSAVASGQGPVLAPGSKLPEPIVPLADMQPIGIRIANCNVIGSFENPQVTRVCELALPPFSEPIVLREVQIHTAPYAEQSGILFWGAQCWARLFFSEDGTNFREIAKFSWPAGDYHGINHVLAVPVGVQASDQAVFRLTVGITSIAPDECRVEAKVYNTRM